MTSAAGHALRRPRGYEARIFGKEKVSSEPATTSAKPTKLGSQQMASPRRAIPRSLAWWSMARTRKRCSWKATWWRVIRTSLEDTAKLIDAEVKRLDYRAPMPTPSASSPRRSKTCTRWPRDCWSSRRAGAARRSTASSRASRGTIRKLKAPPRSAALLRPARPGAPPPEPVAALPALRRNRLEADRGSAATAEVAIVERAIEMSWVE